MSEDFNKYNVFIETGTCQGGTTFQMEPFFQKLYTIEINNDLYNAVVNKYKGNKITFIHGNSGEEIKKILTQCDNDKVLFFLDGHVSDSATCDFNIYPFYTPLREEIESINKLCKNEALIIIDDCRDLGTKNNSNWEFITEKVIREILGSRLISLYYLDCENFKNDRMIITIKSI
jgi:hypothetical protein